MNSIFSRRSIRKYKDIPVEEEKIHSLLCAAMSSPTAKNLREWEFFIITDKDKLKELSAASPYAGPVAKAPLAIVPCGNSDIWDPAWFEQDMGACCENILLEAVELGLGGLWMGICPNEERMDAVAKIIGAPSNLKPFCILAIGYPDESPAARGGFEENKVHYIK